MSVSSTAYWAAAARAEEHGREDRLFTDPFAAEFAGETGVKLLTYLDAKDGGRNPFVSIRTKLIDTYLAEFVGQHDIRQIVNLAAGFDARVARLQVPYGTRFFEIDQEEIISRKKEVFRKMCGREPENWRPISCALEDPWERLLSSTEFSRESPTAWIAEGLLYYLEPDLIRSILARLSELSCCGSVLLCDLINVLMVTSELPSVRKLNQNMRDVGAPIKTGIDDPVSFLKDWGWSVEQLHHPGEADANFGRWPARIPVIPRGYPGFPRYFVISARKLG